MCLPVIDSSMRFQQEPCPVFPSLFKGALDVVEVCYRPWRSWVRGEELYHQALQLLPAGVLLRGRDGKDLIQLLKFSLREVYRTIFYVDLPSQEILHAGPVSLPRLELPHTHGVVGFSRKGRGNPFQGPDRYIKDLELSVLSLLYRCDHIII